MCKFEDTIDIPDFISEIINKKISLHYYVSKFAFEYDNNFEENIFKNLKSNHWTQFIIGLNKSGIIQDYLIDNFENVEKIAN